MRMYNNLQLPPYAEHLNEAQIKALMHHQGPAMILAGPGSGKTTVLTGRVQYLITHHKVAPSSILVITYTKAAALSMQQRFIRENRGEVKPVVFGTFHAICYQILKNQYHLKSDCLLSEQDKKKIIKSLLREQKQNTESEDTDILLGCISMHKSGMEIQNLPIPPTVSEENFANLYQAYIYKCMVLGKMDFDDMLLRCLKLFTEREDVLTIWQKRFPYILVDEFQDCDRTQFAILQLLAGKEANLFVVGDDDQSIYGFRGATPGIMKQFAEIYPHAEKICLEANYRSCKEIVEASNKVIAENGDRFGKVMFSAKDEGNEMVVHGDRSPIMVVGVADKEAQNQFICERIKEMSKEMAFRDMAVICRTNREVTLFLPVLEQAGIPYTLIGKHMSHYAHFTVKDMVAYLQAALGDYTRSNMLVFMNKPVRGIRREDLSEGKVSMDILAEKYQRCGNIDAAEQIIKLQKDLKRVASLSPWAAISYIRKMVGYDDWLKQKAGNDLEKRKEWLQILDTVHKEAKKYGTLQEWLSFVQQESMKPVESASQNGVRLMTMHSAKGLEFSYVCLPDVNEGEIPHGRMLSIQVREEERRLFYVGMTRAKKALDILYLTGTKEYPKLPSSFLNPIMKDYSSTNSSNS